MFPDKVCFASVSALDFVRIRALLKESDQLWHVACKQLFK